MRTIPLPPLPVPVRPFPTETLVSYLARLAAANHLRQTTLRRYLHRPGTPGTGCCPGRLAAATGRPLPALCRALPELRPHPDRPDRGWPEGWHRALACQQCTTRHGIPPQTATTTAPVTCWVPDHHTICLTHWRWIGPGVTRPAQQLDLAAAPEIVRAARRHRAQVRRHGLHQALPAYRLGLRIVACWDQRGEFDRHRQRRLNLLCPPGQTWIPYDDPVLPAAAYPDAVTLAGLFASTRWTATAAAPDPRDRQRFYTEAARRLDLPEYTPHPRAEPLAQWAAHDAAWMHTQLQQHRKDHPQ